VVCRGRESQSQGHAPTPEFRPAFRAVSFHRCRTPAHGSGDGRPSGKAAVRARPGPAAPGPYLHGSRARKICPLHVPCSSARPPVDRVAAGRPPQTRAANVLGRPGIRSGTRRHDAMCRQPKHGPRQGKGVGLWLSESEGKGSMRIWGEGEDGVSRGRQARARPGIDRVGLGWVGLRWSAAAACRCWSW
jgi:hypothetical protein